MLAPPIQCRSGKSRPYIAAIRISLRMETPLSVNPSYLSRNRRPLARQVVHADFHEGGPAGQAINQAEQLAPHDRTPLFDHITAD
jgi:hypothetical protein